MGYDLTRFVKEVDEEFICPICTMVLENGVQSQHCEHTYCDACIREWLMVNKICPIDRRELNLKSINPIPRILKKLLHKLEIKCDFEPQGCEAVMKLENLDSHHKSCSFNPNLKITCNRECGLMMTRNEFESHNCFRKLASVVVAQQKRISYLETELKKHSWYSPNALSIHYNTIQFTHSDFVKCRHGIAQHNYPLTEDNPYFEMQIIETGDNQINLGISCYRLTQYSLWSEPKGIYYNGNTGFAYIFIACEQMTINIRSLPKWETGDTIGCGVKFAKPLENNASLVYFTRNDETVFEKSLNIVEFGLYPTFYTNSVGAKVIVTII